MLGPVPLHVFRHKMLFKFVGWEVDVPGDRLVKKAFAQAQHSCTLLV